MNIPVNVGGKIVWLVKNVGLRKTKVAALHTSMDYKLYHGDALEVLTTLPENSLESLVTDPPAGIGFMGKEWDKDKGGKKQWKAWLTQIMKEALRVMKPGAHALVWAIPRTSHWTMDAVEDAGFEIRDVITHLHAQGFPKGQDVGKQIDKKLGAERKVVGKNPNHRGIPSLYDGAFHKGDGGITVPTTDEAKQWDGWNTAMKPACEYWILARKPLSEKTMAANVLKWGVGCLNIGGCRIPCKTGDEPKAGLGKSGYQPGKGDYNEHRPETFVADPNGRYPANLIHDGSEPVMDEFEKYGNHPSGGAWKVPEHGGERVYGKYGAIHNPGHNDDGSIARFFFCAKSSAKERNAGLDDKRANGHPTVKPLALMRYLCRLITPKGGTVLDCFMGSGSTGVAALQEGFKFIGIEMEQDYLKIAEARIKAG